MQKKLNSMPDYQARMPRQPHDMEQGYVFTSAPAQILPVYYDMLHLGDKLHFKGNIFSRFNPLIAPALGKVDIMIDYFFVPLSVLYTPSPSLFYQTDDLLSSTISPLTLQKDNFPAYDINQTIQDYFDDQRTLADDAVMFVTPNTNRVYPNLIFDCYGRSAHRMLDMFGYNHLAIFGTQAYKNPVSTPWFLAAYQAIYQLSNLYRNDDREPKNYHYNFDKYYNVATFTELPTAKPLFALNYANRPKDYFNAVKVSPIATSVSMLSWQSTPNQPTTHDWTRLFQPNDAKDDSSNFPAYASNPSRFAANPVQQPETITQVLARNGTYGGSSITTMQIRQMFAFEKLLRVIGRAEKNYESQFLAHFGVKVPHDVMHNITHIGRDHTTLEAEPVISQANTFDENSGTGSALGELSGQGSVTFNGGPRSFTAPCHGVFMVLVHWMPRFFYERGVDKLHDLSTPISFWQPEYDKLGVQPLYQYEGDRYNFGNSTRYGWQYRYEQFKRKYDIVSCAFVDPARYNGTVNTYSPWVIQTKPFGYRDASSNVVNQYTPDMVWSLKGSPTDLNGIMQVPYDTRWSNDFNDTNYWLIYQKDPFINNFYFDCTKVNFMSEFGEPEL